MKRLTILVIVLLVATVSAVVVRQVVHQDREPLIIVHWANSHPMRPGLLPDMAETFNAGNHKTASGQPIEVHVVSCDSAAQIGDLVSRLKGTQSADGCTADGSPAGNPTIVTPQSGDWLVDLNDHAGHEAVDIGAANHIAETWLGIVTYRAMAECLGWPDKELGYTDILALSADPKGWAAYPDCAQTKWGKKPLVAFTNPSTSTSGRNVLISLYSIATKKPPGDLTVADVERADVFQYVQNFQHLVGHYLPTTSALNTKIVQGPRQGNFFLMPEDNLANLYLGTEKFIDSDGTAQPLSPLKEDLVMIYPKEGSVLNSNPAGVVNASWVTSDMAASRGQCTHSLRDDDQQKKIIASCFRPVNGPTALDPQSFERWGLDARVPSNAIEPGDIHADVLSQIIGDWGSVKNSAIVTFAVDVSGSMAGKPLDDVKDGLGRLLDAMGRTNNGNQVGLVTFNDKIVDEVAPQPLRTSKFDIAEAVNNMQASGGTALFDAVARAIQ